MAATTSAADLATFRTTRVRVLQATVVLATIVLWRSALDSHATFKVAAITTGAVVLVALAVLETIKARAVTLPSRLISIVSAVYGVALLLCTAVSDDRWRSLLGARGRGTGLLLYGALLVLFVVVIARFDRGDVEALLLAVAGSAVLVALYAISQTIGFDPFHVSSGYGAAASTLGNPNFVSAYLAVALPLLFLWSRRVETPRERYALLGAAAVLVLGIVVAKSAQGFVAAGLGCLVPASAYARRLSRELRRSLGGALFGFLVVVVAVVGLGGLGKGPLGHQLGHGGRDQRVAFWRAGAEMVGDHPVLGVGLDGYGRYYRAYRSQEEALSRGVYDAADEPHNVPLGMFVGGGLVLGLAYLAFVLVTGSVLLDGLRQLPPDDALPLFAVGGAWFAYQVQSVISIDAPPLALVHYLLAAAVVVLAGRVTVRTWRAPARRGPRGRRQPVAPPLHPAVVGGVAVGALVVLSMTLRPAYAELRAASGTHASAQSAITSFKAAHAALPGEPAFDAELGRVVALVNGPQAGLPYYRKAVAADDRSLVYLLPLARLADAAGNVDEARNAYRRAAEVDPVAPEILLEQAKFELKQRNARVALDLFQRVQKLEPISPRDTLYIADAYTLLNQPDEARKIYDKVLADSPRDVDLRQALGESALKAQDYARAAQLFQQAIDVDRGRGALWYDLGQALEKQGDSAGALKAYTEALLHPPSDPGLGPALKRLGYKFPGEQ